MLFIICFIFVVVGILGLVEHRMSERAVSMAYLSVYVVLMLVTGFRPEGIDKDYSTYISYFYGGDYDVTVEWSFSIIVGMLRLFTENYVWMFVVYAFMAFSLYFLAIARATKNARFLSLAVFMGTSYLVHCMNQIRFAVAAGIILVALQVLAEKRRWKYVLLILLAVFFHYSAALFLFLAFLSPEMRTTRSQVFWALIIPFAYVLYLMHIDLILSIPIPYVTEKIEIYERLTTMGVGDVINPFNMVLLVKIAMLYFIMWYVPLLREKTPLVDLLMKVEVISITSFVLFTTIPVMSFRVSEAFGIAEILLYPMLVYTVKPDILGRAIVLIVSAVLMVINIFYNQVLVV